MYKVDPTSEESAAVRAVFLAEPPQRRHYGGQNIPGRWSSHQETHIQRIQHACQQGMQVRHDVFRNSLNAQAVRFKADVHARWLFHGPGNKEALDSITNTIDGFNPLLTHTHTHTNTHTH